MHEKERALSRGRIVSFSITAGILLSCRFHGEILLCTVDRSSDREKFKFTGFIERARLNKIIDIAIDV